MCRKRGGLLTSLLEVSASVNGNSPRLPSASVNFAVGVQILPWCILQVLHRVGYFRRLVTFSARVAHLWEPQWEPQWREKDGEREVDQADLSDAAQTDATDEDVEDFIGLPSPCEVGACPS